MVVDTLFVFVSAVELMGDIREGRYGWALTMFLVLLLWSWFFARDYDKFKSAKMRELNEVE